MPIKEKDLLKLIDIEKSHSRKSKISFDGKNLLTRFPKDIVETLKLTKGQKIEWVVDSSGGVKISLI